MKSGCIYALHAGDGVFKYVGLTGQKVDARLNQHRAAARNASKLKVHRWIADVGPDLVQIEVLEEVANAQLLGEREQEWVARLIADGCKLLNATIGGQRGNLGFKHSDEERARRSERMKGKTPAKGAVRSTEYREKMSKALTGKRCIEGCTCKRHSPSPERGANISKAIRLRSVS